MKSRMNPTLDIDLTCPPCCVAGCKKPGIINNRSNMDPRDIYACPVHAAPINSGIVGLKCCMKVPCCDSENEYREIMTDCTQTGIYCHISEDVCTGKFQKPVYCFTHVRHAPDHMEYVMIPEKCIIPMCHRIVSHSITEKTGTARKCICDYHYKRISEDDLSRLVCEFPSIVMGRTVGLGRKRPLMDSVYRETDQMAEVFNNLSYHKMIATNMHVDLTFLQSSTLKMYSKISHVINNNADLVIHLSNHVYRLTELSKMYVRSMEQMREQFDKERVIREREMAETVDFLKKKIFQLENKSLGVFDDSIASPVISADVSLSGSERSLSGGLERTPTLSNVCSPRSLSPDLGSLEFPEDFS